MAEPDLFEGDDEVREAVCDHAGHDWIDGALAADVPGASAGAEVCTTCGAMRTVASSRAEGSRG